jgi:TetR/AcrR family transcriptional regulator, mexJK operon transcriptional repressor
MSTAAMGEPADERRSARKRRAIIEAATAAFLEHGYRGTSMDAVAAAAGVSKQTVYQHFGDKQRLFRELIAATVQAASDPVHDEVRRLADSGSLDSDLRDLARRLLKLVLQPRMLRLRRLVIAESRRFPELGRVFYDLGPGRTIATLADTFAELTRQGRLKTPDAGLAATQFNWLVMAAPLNQAMLLGRDDPPTTREINKWAGSGVRAFLAAYAPEPEQRPRPSAIRARHVDRTPH